MHDLRARGQEVCIVDDDPDTRGTADTDAEREFIDAYYAEMRETWNVGVHCGTLLMWQAENDGAAEAQRAKDGSKKVREALVSLPPESRRRVAKVVTKLLRSPRSDGSPPILPLPSAVDEQK